MTDGAPTHPGWNGWWSSAAMEMAGRDYRAGNPEAVAQRCAEIIAHDAWHFEALYLLGTLCLERTRFQEAAGWLDRAVRAQPEAAAAHFHLGKALAGDQRHETAIAAQRRAFALAPGSIDALNEIGNAFAALGRLDEAIAHYQLALAIRPDHAPLLFNLGKRLSEAGRLEEAADSFRKAKVSAGPKEDPARITDIHIELGRALMELGRPEEALAITRTMPSSGASDWYTSLVLLALGHYGEGWPKYEARYAVEDRKPPHPDARAIDLADISGKRVLVCAEQGFGDTIQFARYVEPLARAGATVSLVVYPELKTLFAAMDNIAELAVTGEAEPAHDLVTAFPSLPLAFRTELSTIPAQVPYLRVPDAQGDIWHRRLGRKQKPRVGICCWGAQHIPNRSLPLSALARVLERTDIEPHLLQKEIAPPDRAWLASHPAVREHSVDLNDFADTAALIAEMDLVITIDTAVAHLAGALARPTWIMLTASADWRWLIGRDDSPWYPTARLFRQPKPNDWDTVAAAVSQALNDHTFPKIRTAPKIRTGKAGRS